MGTDECEADGGRERRLGSGREAGVHPDRDRHAVRRGSAGRRGGVRRACCNHVVDHGSDGFVVAGTTGEAPTLTDEEHLRRHRARGRSELGDGATVVAGTGSNDTRHAVHLTERATELGADAILSVTPYYNKPNRRGIVAPLSRRSRRRTDKPDRPLQHPAAHGRRHAQRPARRARADRRTSSGVKQANNDNLALVDGLDALRRQRRHVRAARSTSAASAASSSPATWSGDEMRRMVDEPEQPRRDRRAACSDALRGAVRHHEPDPGQGRAEPARPQRRRPAAAARRGRRQRRSP